MTTWPRSRHGQVLAKGEAFLPEIATSTKRWLQAQGTGAASWRGAALRGGERKRGAAAGPGELGLLQGFVFRETWLRLQRRKWIRGETLEAIER